MYRFLLACSLVLSFALPAAANNHPPLVEKAVSDMDDMCRAAGATPAPSDGLVQALDLNFDSVLDYAVYEGAYVCDGAASLFAGTAGSTLTVFVSGKNGKYASAWSGMVYGAKLSETIPPVLWVDVGGEVCGQKGQVVHATMDSCSRALVWNATASKIDYDALSNAKPISAAE